MKSIKYANFRHAQLIEVLKIEVNEGEGTSTDPVRRVAYICSKKGRVLGKLGEETEREFAGSDEMIEV